MSTMKLKPVDPAKFDALSKTELRDLVVRTENAKVTDKWMTAQGEQRILRMGSAAGAALLTGILYEKKPELESIMGTPASLDHLLALGGGIGAYLAKDEDTACALEGVCLAGAVPLARNFGRTLAGMVIK